MTRKILLAACAVLALGATSAQAAPPAHIAAAVASADRPAADKERDATRKPAEMLEFAGVKAGDVVIELIPGAGYFTRVLSAAVGPNGKVFAAVSPTDLDKAKAAAVGNVTPVAMTGAAFKPPQPADLIFTAQNYHDLHLKRLGLDVPAVNKALFEALKPGGTLLIIDHTAVAGAPLETADTLHRIDPAQARKELEAAGFMFAGENTALRNPGDSKTVGVFDASIRGKSDQFVYKFKKPG